MAQNGNNAAYSSKYLKMTQKRLKMSKMRLTLQNSSKWQKRSLLVKMAQNGKNAACENTSKWQKRGFQKSMA